MEPKNTVSIFDRLVQEAIGDNVHLGDDFDKAKTDYPALWAFLTQTDAGPNHVKDPAKLSIRGAPGGWFVSLSDDAFGKSIDASCETLAEVFLAMEMALNQPQPAIRSWPNHEPKLRKKKAVK